MNATSLTISNIHVPFYNTHKNSIHKVNLFYQSFGPKIGQAPIILLIHALTGNSNISGTSGWWNKIVGSNLSIDTSKYTLIAFNIPGNEFPSSNDLEMSYKNYTIHDIAQLFWKGLEVLRIDNVHSIIGLSLGGCIAWEMTLLFPQKIKKIISVAATHQSNAWLKAHTFLQEQLLLSGQEGVKLARMQSMMMFRTPVGFEEKFKKENSNASSIAHWLLYHGQSLVARFSQHSYLIMNQLLHAGGSPSLWNKNTAINAALEIHRVIIPGDLLFTEDAFQNEATQLKILGLAHHDHFIHSPQGHDAFLIEHKQIEHIFKYIFDEKN